MIFDPLIFTEEEILELLENAKTALKAGKSVVSWSSLGSSATMQWDMSPLNVIKECTLYLKTIKPETYGRVVKVGKILHP